MTDLEIVHQVKVGPISEVVKELGLDDSEVFYYGTDKAKVHLTKKRDHQGKLILVTAINPTPYGEGKTTVSIGLADALRGLGKKSILALRQPSMGPVFGMKGGATGGGYSQVVPMEDINLHFTGDFHAITACNNLLCAAIDNHIKQGNDLALDPEKITFHRCLDVNDRALREVTIGLGGRVNGAVRSEQFTITAASEIMALFCLATSLADLKKRLGDIVIGYTKEGTARFAKDLKIEGALTVLLKDAIHPNLVQTLEGTPAFIHGGPFANIAHGCNSVIATKTALSLGDYVVTEAGFGADLGAEKFLDLKCPKAGLAPSCIVLVVTVKALKYNAKVPKEDIYKKAKEKVKEGLMNLEAHIDNLKQYGVPLVVAINRYQTDCEEELQVIRDFCKEKNVAVSCSTAYTDGGKGASELAKEVLKAIELPNDYHPLYENKETYDKKIEMICSKIYHASEVVYTEEARKKLALLVKNGFDGLPICIAKTQYSLSDDAKKLGAPSDYTVTVRDVELYHGAGFVTVLLGDILRMPGLPKKPNYELIDIDSDGTVTGIF